MALTTDKLDQFVSSELPGNPPLWIARRDANAYQFDLFVNDARVVRGDIKATSSQQDQQVSSSPSFVALFHSFNRTMTKQTTRFLFRVIYGALKAALRKKAYLSAFTVMMLPAFFCFNRRKLMMPSID